MDQISINILSILIVAVLSALGGLLLHMTNQGLNVGKLQCKPLLTKVTIPPLVSFTQLGMMLFGIIARNSFGDIVGEMDQEWSLQIRSIALTVILLRAGMGLDIAKLKSMSSAVLRLTATPQIVEASAIAISSYLLIGMPWALAFAMGFMLAAVSPAVVVPSCIRLRNMGYGQDKGITSLVIAASSLDDVLAICSKLQTVFGVFLSIGIGNESGGNHVEVYDDSLWNTVILALLEIIGGFACGILVGIFLWLVKPCNPIVKGIIAFITSFAMVFPSSYFGLSGLGYLATITSTAVASIRWGSEEANKVDEKVGLAWKVLQVLLFGLIGASVYLGDLKPDIVGFGLLIILIGQIFRFPIAFISVFRTELNFKERLFVAIAWMPKATVQAALGGVVLGQAEKGDNDDNITQGENILTIAVLCILVTAPIGAILTAFLGPLFLHKENTEEVVPMNPATSNDEQAKIVN